MITNGPLYGPPRAPPTNVEVERTDPSRADQAVCYGAGDRDRTGMASLEGWGSAIELHPRGPADGSVRRTHAVALGCHERCGA